MKFMEEGEREDWDEEENLIIRLNTFTVESDRGAPKAGFSNFGYVVYETDKRGYIGEIARVFPPTNDRDYIGVEFANKIDGEAEPKIKRPTPEKMKRVAKALSRSVSNGRGLDLEDEIPS